MNYVAQEGRIPFDEWLDSLRDVRTVAKVLARLERVEDGNLGNVGPIGGGVSELKIDYGPGYRVYFGNDGPEVIVLLCGGEKSSQARDIRTAKKCWEDYKRKGEGQ